MKLDDLYQDRHEIFLVFELIKGGDVGSPDQDDERFEQKGALFGERGS